MRIIAVAGIGWSGFILSGYMIFFGLLILGAGVKADVIKPWFGFMYHFLGRGFFHL